MKKFKDTINNFESHNPIPLFFEHGYTPEIIKEEIISSFSDFFENKSNLSSHAIDGLTTTWLSFLTSTKERGFNDRLKKISSLNRLAFKIDSLNASTAYFDWSGTLSEATNKYWSIKNLEQATGQLCLEDMVAASFQMLGQLIESLIKPYIKFHYQLFSIANDRPIDTAATDKLDLGKTLEGVAAISNTLLIMPLKISLNQWRNIAYHHSYLIEGSKITCTYGNINQKKKIILSRKQLQTIVKSVYTFYKTLKISETILIYDNLEIIQQFSATSDGQSASLRDEGHLIGLYSAMSTQGFLIKDLVIDKIKTTLTVQDLLDKDSYERGIHSSQFLQIIWRFSKTKIIEVVYKKKDGSSYLISSIDNETLDRFTEGKLQIKELIDYTEFDFVGDPTGKGKIPSLKKNIKKPIYKNPFNIHLVMAVPTKEKYYSQKGEQIDVKHFIRDFSLAIFSNYLVFQKLGYSSDKIKINIGKDGSMVLLEDKENLLIRVPATIKEKFIQQLIILCVSDLINFFEKHQLVETLVTEAMQRNNFETNLSLMQNYRIGK